MRTSCPTRFGIGTARKLIDKIIALSTAHRLRHHPVTGGIDHSLAQARAGKRFALKLVICHQPGRRGLGAAQDRSHQLIAQRPGKAKLRDGQIFRRHGGQPSHERFAA